MSPIKNEQTLELVPEPSSTCDFVSQHSYRGKPIAVKEARIVATYRDGWLIAKSSPGLSDAPYLFHTDSMEILFLAAREWRLAEEADRELLAAAWPEDWNYPEDSRHD